VILSPAPAGLLPKRAPFPQGSRPWAKFFRPSGAHKVGPCNQEATRSTDFKCLGFSGI
jgi:hypothetical protein